jgi:preprotein translocase SecE subunit
MAVAEKPTPEPKASKKPSQPLGLVFTSIIGTLFVLAGAALVLRGVPWVWNSGIGSGITNATNSFVSAAVLITIQATLAILLFIGGSKLDKSHTTTGTRGGIFFMLAVVFVGFFAVKGLYNAAGRGFSFANIVVMLFYVIIIFLLIQFFRTGRFTKWSLTMDQAGWFDTHTHKRTQGLRVRRLTILGLLAIAASGIWTLTQHGHLPENANVKMPDGTERSNRLGDWVIGGTLLEPDAKKLTPEENRARPRVDGGVTILPDLQFTVPLILIAATIWFAWRAVNYPTFGDFLIATEAEINKVSWASRKALVRDTIVVLTALLLLTLFLFVVDMFWGWLLSQSWFGVLPSSEEIPKPQKAEPVNYW